MINNTPPTSMVTEQQQTGNDQLHTTHHYGHRAAADWEMTNYTPPTSMVTELQRGLTVRRLHRVHLHSQ
jgi:hypothetical protein